MIMMKICGNRGTLFDRAISLVGRSAVGRAQNAKARATRMRLPSARNGPGACVAATTFPGQHSERRRQA